MRNCNSRYFIMVSLIGTQRCQSYNIIKNQSNKSISLFLCNQSFVTMKFVSKVSNHGENPSTIKMKTLARDFCVISLSAIGCNRGHGNSLKTGKENKK